MIRLSSHRAFIVKWVTPALVTIGCIIYAAVEWSRSRNAAAFLLVTLVVAAIAFFMGRRRAGLLADTVLDGGDHLVVMRNGLVERIALTEIAEVLLVDQPMGTSVIVLRLATPHRIGSEVVLAPIDLADPLGRLRGRVPVSVDSSDPRPGLIPHGVSFTAKRFLAGIALAFLLFCLADRYVLHVLDDAQGRTLRFLSFALVAVVALLLAPTAAEWRAHYRTRERGRS